VTETELRRLAESPLVLRVQEDKPVPPDLASTIPLIRADVAATNGFTGQGQIVAILDTGIDTNHEFLNGRTVAEACFSTTSASGGAASTCPNGTDAQTGTGAAAPCGVARCDHGTHVAGIATGRDPGTRGFNGVAPDANIIAIQVFSVFTDNPSRGIMTCANSGMLSPCPLTFTADQMLGLEHVFSLRSDFDIAAVNMSLSGGKYTVNCDEDVRKDAIDDLRAAGIATVIAAGNDGFTDSLGAPACISSAISVGATTDADAYATSLSEAVDISLAAAKGELKPGATGAALETKGKPAAKDEAERKPTPARVA